MLALFRLIAYLAGVVSFFFYPDYVSRRSYISENALIPEAASNEFGEYQTRIAFDFSSQISSEWRKLQTPTLNVKKISVSNRFLISFHLQQMSAILFAKLKEKRLECYSHSFNAHNQTLENIYCVVRAFKSSGTESLLISTKYG